jgi:ATP-binding cassette subfamily C protein
VADLVLGLLKPRSGGVFVGETLLDAMHLQDWRDKIGYVQQDTYLFNDTVRANLLWAQPDASEDDLQQALVAASADRFVAAMPDGLNTVIGERGVTLSGGEKQRISLARALLRKPDLLILDEATNALDSENEDRIFNAIAKLHGVMTIIVITHRLSSIRSVDRIHVLDQGSVVASGTWDEITASDNPRFRELCAAQGIARETESSSISHIRLSDPTTARRAAP